MAVRWRAEVPPDPRLLALNEPLGRRARSRRGLAAQRRRPAAAGRRSRCRTEPRPVAQAYAGHQFGGFVPRLGDGRALLLGELVGTDGTVRDLHLKGSGARRSRAAATASPRSGRCCASTSSARRCTPSASPPPAPSPSWPRVAAVHRETLLPGAVLARVASSHLRVGSFQYAAATGDVDLLRRLADHAIARHHPSAADAENPYLRAVRGGRRRPGVAGGAVDARRVRARRDEHRQHDDLRRDHRLRAVRVHGGLRPGDGVQLDRHAGAATPTATSRRSRSGTSPASPRRCCPSFADDQDQAVALAQESLDGFRGRYVAAWSAGMRAKLGLPRRRR